MLTPGHIQPRVFSSPLGGVALMVLATLFTSLAMVLNKFLVQDYSAYQIVFWRSVFSLIPLTVLVYRQGGVSSLKTSQATLLSLRGLMGFVCMVAYCYALQGLSIFTADCLLHLQPVFVFFMAALLLHEKIPKSSFIALSLSLLGLFIISKPGSDVATFSALFALAAGFFYAVEVVITRHANFRDTPVTMFAYYSVVCLIGSGVVSCVEGFSFPAPQDYILFVLIAMVNLGINLAFTEALRRAPASQLAPLEYLTLVWVILWQIQIWGDIPELSVVLGGVLILSGGVLLLRKSLKKEAPSIGAPRPTQG